MNNIEFHSGAINPGEAISGAWEMLKRNYGMFLGIALLAYVFIACIPCLNFVLIGPVMGGVYYVALRDMRGEPVDFGMMFKGFEKFMPLMIIGLLQSIPGIVAQVLQYALQIGGSALDGGRGRGLDFFQASSSDLALGGGITIIVLVVAIVFVVIGFLWWAAFFFAIPLVMEYDLGPGEAIKLSVQAAMNNLGGLFVFMILCSLVMLLGVLMICIGLFLVSIPIWFLSGAFVYRMVFPDTAKPFNMAPPPPTEYGFGGGQYA